jgi:hypothetical protein
MGESQDKPDKPTESDLEAARLARRKLLKLMAYAAPVIVGTFTTRRAAAQTCGPYPSCGPDWTCIPDGGCFPTWPCSPDYQCWPDFPWPCWPDLCGPAGAG